MSSYKIMHLSFIFLISVALPIANASDVGRSFCRRTTHNSVCQSTVDADRRANLKTTPNGIATILRDAALGVASTTSSKISTLLRSANRREVESLKTCSAGYSDAVSHLRAASFGVINRATYSAVIASISDANDVPRDCELSFQEPPAVTSPISAENQRLKEMLATALEIVNLVVCNHPSFC